MTISKSAVRSTTHEKRISPASENLPLSVTDDATGDSAVGSDRGTAQPDWPRGWWIATALVIGYLVHVGWRVWLAQSVPTPVAHADEDRYLLAARVLAGGPGGFGNDTEAFRALGYPLLLTPIYWFTNNPFTVFHAAQAIGAVVNALAFPLMYLFGRRILGTDRRISLGVAVVLATLPSVAYYSEFALTDAIFAPIGLGWLLLVHAQLTSRGASWRTAAGVGAGAVVGYASVVHVRGWILIGIHLIFLAGLAVTRRSPWVISIASAATAVVMSRVEWVAEQFVGDRLAHGGIEPDHQLLSRLTDARGAVHTICDAAGQIWYSGVGTWGLAAVGLVVGVQRIRSRYERAETDVPQRVVLAAAMAATVLIALGSAAALPEDGRVSNFAYPRYIAFLMPVWAFVGVVALIRTGRQSALRLVGAAAAIMGAGAFVVLARQSELVRHWFHPFDTPEVSFITYTWTAMPVARATVAAVLLLLGIAAVLASARPRAMATGLVCVTLINLVGMEVVNAKSVRPMATKQYATAPRLVEDLGIGPGDVLATTGDVDLAARMNHQREVYWSVVRSYDDQAAAPPAEATVVVAPWHARGDRNDWNGEDHGWRRIAGDPVNEWAVWLRDSDPRRRGDAPWVAKR